MRSALFGRRIQIAGSVVGDATTADIDSARELVVGLAKRLLQCGANFVVPVDAERLRDGDSRPICFDWLVWKTIYDGLLTRPADTPGPLAIAVQHHKTEDQIPLEYATIWDELRDSEHVRIESAAHWNMNAKRMEAQARFGDVLIAIGGGEGVLYLANLYHDAGKAIVPLNLPLCPETTGARRLHDFGLASANTRRLLRLDGGEDAHARLNLLRFPARQEVSQRIDAVMDLLERVERPMAFAVRLLNPEHRDYAEVQAFFEVVVRPVIEDDFGYRLAVIDGKHVHEYARVDQEIFAKLHRSALVVADITGSRPNRFLELGYALGRQLPTVVTARADSDLPFDITTFAGHRWRSSSDIEERRRAFREHINAVRNRPPLIDAEPLIA